MCKGSRTKFCSTDLTMEGENFEKNKNGVFLKTSILLELAAADDVSGFKSEVEAKGISADEVSFWYGRRVGSKSEMGFEERTPLMIASLYGSIQVLKYMVNAKKVNVHKTSGSDGATALHCAAAGGSSASVEAVKLLLDACAEVNAIDANGNKPGDLIARGIKSSQRKSLEMLLKGFAIEETEIITPKKEYPIDVPLPDINKGEYVTDEFRMFTFKVKPCSRAYSHDWTECPFVHPGENARRRDPKKFGYSCVPCPEFRKGSCAKGDECEYAHGVFESWLHPAQYRTRLCKDETGCARKVCFFAHRVEELRPLYAATGSAMPSPTSGSAGSIEAGSMSPLALGSTPSSNLPSSNLWQNKMNHSTPPALQLPGSRLKTSLHARDLENLRSQHQMNSHRFGELKPSNLDDVFGSFDSSMLSQLQGLSPKNLNPIRASYPTSNYSASPVRKPAYGFDSSAAVAQAVMNSRSGVFAKQRSQSFIDRGTGTTMSHGSMAQFSEWGSPDGKLDWGFNGEEANKLRKSASFGFRNSAPVKVSHEPDVSWVNTLVKDVSSVGAGLPQWVEQMYMEEQLVA